MIYLKSCPLCKGEAVFDYVSQVRSPWSRVGIDSMGFTVRCVRCGCTIPSKMTREQAAFTWNTRPEEGLMGRLRRMFKKGKEDGKA